MITTIAFDPGGGNGWATFEDVTLKKMGTVNVTVANKAKKQVEDIEPFLRWLSEQPAYDVVVIERYVIRPPKSGGYEHVFDTGLTLRLIGCIHFWAYSQGSVIVMQNSDIKIPASGMIFKKPYEKRKGQHHWDAVLHGYYYLVGKGGFSIKDIGK